MTTDAWRHKSQWLEELGAVAEVPHPVVHMALALHTWARAKPPLTCYPSVATLAGYAGVSETRANELLRDLQHSGWIAVTRRGRSTNLYELTRGEPLWPDDAAVQRPPARRIEKPRLDHP